MAAAYPHKGSYAAVDQTMIIDRRGSLNRPNPIPTLSQACLGIGFGLGSAYAPRARARVRAGLRAMARSNKAPAAAGPTPVFCIEMKKSPRPCKTPARNRARRPQLAPAGDASSIIHHKKARSCCATPGPYKWRAHPALARKRGCLVPPLCDGKAEIDYHFSIWHHFGAQLH